MTPPEQGRFRHAPGMPKVTRGFFPARIPILPYQPFLRLLTAVGKSLHVTLTTQPQYQIVVHSTAAVRASDKAVRANLPPGSTSSVWRSRSSPTMRVTMTLRLPCSSTPAMRGKFALLTCPTASVLVHATTAWRRLYNEGHVPKRFSVHAYGILRLRKQRFPLSTTASCSVIIRRCKALFLMGDKGHE